MLITALLLLFTLLCILLSADHAWDNVTKPERNELVFDGRHRGYGAFVLRREYEHRFILAFFGAIAIGAAAVTLPKVLVLLTGSTIVDCKRPPVFLQRIVDLPPYEIPKTKPEVAPARSKPAGPSAPKSSGDPVVVLTKDTIREDPQPKEKKPEDPVAPNGGGTGKPDPGKLPLEGGTTGSEFGTRKNPTGAADVDSLPEFIGGTNALNRFVQNNIRFPNDDGAHEKEWIEFVVDSDGSIVDVRTKGRASKAYSMAAAQVVSMMPKWKPAIRKGEKVACVLVLPIDFRTK